jgi:hypothetical protein
LWGAITVPTVYNGVTFQSEVSRWDETEVAPQFRTLG